MGDIYICISYNARGPMMGKWWGKGDLNSLSEAQC